LIEAHRDWSEQGDGPEVALDCGGELVWRGPWRTGAVGLTVASMRWMPLDDICADQEVATPVGRRSIFWATGMIENVYFTTFAVVGMVSLWLPGFSLRVDGHGFLAAAMPRAFGWGTNAMLHGSGEGLVARVGAGIVRGMKCLCFATWDGAGLTRGPVALIGELARMRRLC